MGIFKIRFYVIRKLFLVFSMALSSQVVQASERLIQPSQLKAKLTLPGIAIIDLRSEEQFLKGHIPNAINLPISKFHRKKAGIEGFIQTPNHFKTAMETAGISNSDHLILYSDWAFLDTARFYWALDFYGHKHKQILDGGYQAWVKNGNTTSQQVAQKRAKTQYIVQVQPSKMATKFQTLMASKSDDYVIVDARPKDHYVGKQSLTQVKGHIPNAINIPWHNLLQNRTAADEYGKFDKSINLHNEATLAKQLNQIPKDKKIILYCNGGAESAVLYLGLKKLGIQASVYDGSWFEWSMDKQLPVEFD